MTKRCRKIVSAIGFAVVCVGSAPTLHAAAITFHDSAGDPSSANITPGGTATFTVTLQSVSPFAGLSLYLDDTTYASTTRFTITDRTTSGSNPFSTAITGGAITSEPVDNQTTDLGYFNGSNIAANSYDLMTLTVTAASNLTPGSTYTIASTSGSSLFDLSANEIALTGGSYTLNVTAVPEPATLGLISLGACVVLFRRRQGLRLK